MTSTRAGEAFAARGAYRRFMTSRLASLFGDGLVAVTLAFAAIELDASEGQVGLVLLAGRLPLAVFTLGGGILSDRVPRKWVLVGADVFRAAVQGVTAALLLTDAATLWHLALLQAATATATAYFNAASPGMIADLLPEDRRQKGNALVSVTQSVAVLVAPAAAGVLVGIAGVGVAFAVDAATFVFSSALLWGLPTIGSPATRRPLVEQAAEGWREFRRWPWIQVLAVQAAVVNGACIAPGIVLGPVVAERELGGIEAWSIVVTAFGAGALFGGLAAMWWRPRFPLRSATVLLVLIGPYLAAVAIVMPLAVIAAAAFAAGAQSSCYNAFTTTVAQNHLPRQTFGRVMAISMTAGVAAQPIGMAVVGFAAQAFTPAAVLWAGAAASAGLVLFGLSIKTVRDMAAAPVRAGDASP